MPKRRLAALAFLLTAASLAFAPTAGADVAIPPLRARVTDLTGTLTAEQKGALEQRLAAFEARKGSQIAVLMLPSTRPEEIEQFSIRLAEAWKVGRKGTDDGLILVVAKEDRRLRIEVGYGLEGAIPDAIAKRVISETITPRFKAGDFYGGISAGIDQLIKLVDGEQLPPPAGAPPRGSNQGAPDPGDWLGPAFLFLLIGGAILRALIGRLPGALAMAVLGGLAGAFLFGVFGAVVCAVVAFIFTLINVGSLASSAGGGFSSGGSSGGSSWGGGGGGFGGGGSSGRW